MMKRIILHFFDILSRLYPLKSLIFYTRGNIAFTLLELLLVLSVIMLLLSILLPALKTAREKAKDIQCKSNLKQCGVVTFMYCNDYNEYLPANNSPSSSPYTYWNVYLDNNIQKICVCPSFAPRKYLEPLSVYGTFTRSGFFKLNSLPQYALSYSKKLNFGILLTDSIMYNTYYAGWYQIYLIYRSTSTTPGNGSVHLRHNSKGNCLFPDGRVEAQNKSQLKSENFKDGCDTYPSVYP